MIELLEAFYRDTVAHVSDKYLQRGKTRTNSSRVRQTRFKIGSSIGNKW